MARVKGGLNAKKRHKFYFKIIPESTKFNL